MASRQSWLGAAPGRKVYGSGPKKKAPGERKPLASLTNVSLAAVDEDEDAWLKPTTKACATPEEKAVQPRSRTTAAAGRETSAVFFVDSSDESEGEAAKKGRAAAKRKTSLGGSVWAGAEEDVEWLREALAEDGFVSFGKRTVRVPRRWRRSRRSPSWTWVPSPS